MIRLMPTFKNVDFFLEPRLRQSAERGEHNFLRLFCEVLREGGLAPRFRDIGSTRDLMDAAPLNITHMKEPLGRRGIVFRRMYHYPFWYIDKTAKRWQWDIAKAQFDPQEIDGQEAQAFRNRWRRTLFPQAVPAPGEGYALIVLQGKILERRSFQSCSPIEMVKAVIDATEEPVIIALHPKESYSAEETSALVAVTAAHKRIHLMTGGAESLLPGCKLVATQNSAVAFDGYFFNKPALLFGRSEFHHIALNTSPKTCALSVVRARTHKPNYAKYLYWFWQVSGINAGRDDAKEKIRARLKRFEWPV